MDSPDEHGKVQAVHAVSEVGFAPPDQPPRDAGRGQSEEKRRPTPRGKFSTGLSTALHIGYERAVDKNIWRSTPLIGLQLDWSMLDLIANREMFSPR